MDSLTLHNFRSYESTHLSELHPRVNVVLGANGHGKSNLLRAIAFTVSDRRGMQSTPTAIEVEVTLRHKLKLQRVWTENVEELRVNGRIQTRNQYEQHVNSCGLVFSNPYNVVQQGKITQVASMDGCALFSLLEEATGLHSHLRQCEEAIHLLKLAVKDKEVIEQSIQEVEGKLKCIESKREDFQVFAMEQQMKKGRLHRNYAMKRAQLQPQLREMKEALADKLRNISASAMQHTKLQEQLQDIEAQLRLNVEKVAVEEGQRHQGVEVRESPRELQMHLESAEKALERVQKERNTILQQIREKQQMVKRLQQKTSVMESSFECAEAQRKGGAWKRDKTEELKRSEELIKSIEMEENKLRSQKGSGTVKRGDDVRRAEERMREVKVRVMGNKIKQIECSRRKNQLEAEVGSLRSQVDLCSSRLRKLLPQMNLGLMVQARKRKLEGVYGFLLELITIQPKVLFAFELAGLQKLCTVVVEDELACGALIALNREMRGRTLQMLVLSEVRRRPIESKMYPTQENVYCLFNTSWVCPRVDLTKEVAMGVRRVLEGVFNKFLLVRDYDTALRIAKESHLTCITAEHEIIHAEGFLCRVGREDVVEDKLALHQRLTFKEQKIKELQCKLEAETVELLKLQKEELEVMRVFTTEEKILEQSLKKQQEQQLILRIQERVDGQIIRLKEKREAVVADITRIKQMLEKGGSIAIVDPIELSRCQNSLKEQREHLKKLLKKEFEFEEEEEACKQRAQQLKTALVVAASCPQLHVDADRLRKERQQLQSVRSRVQEEHLQREEELLKLRNDAKSLSCDACICQEQLLQVESKMAALNYRGEDKDNAENENSNSGRGRLHHFTAKDKLLFAKFSALYEQFQKHRSSYNRLQAAERELKDKVDRFLEDRERATEEAVLGFKREFGVLIERVVPEGRWELKVRPSTEGRAVRGALILKVGFKGEKPKLLNELSGGEKAVVALCMLLALQRLETAPFYILDEIDSALDWLYAEKVISLILEESACAQFFLTTFKQETIRMIASAGNEYARFFAVETNNRVSSVKELPLHEVDSFAQQIAN